MCSRLGDGMTSSSESSISSTFCVGAGRVVSFCCLLVAGFLPAMVEMSSLGILSEGVFDFDFSFVVFCAILLGWGIVDFAVGPSSKSS